MSNNLMSDIADHLDKCGIGKRRDDVFTIAEQGALENRPLSVVVRQNASSRDPEVTEPVDYMSLRIIIAGSYGMQGEDNVANKADEVYRSLLLVTDETINGTLYLNIRAASSPALAGFDEFQRTVYEFDVEVMRFNGGT